MKPEYKHLQAAHCENGVTTSLLQHYGVHQITEPLAFGIGSGLFFIYIPFMKVNDGPAISFRTMPGMIFKRTCKSLDIPILRQKFSSKEKAQQALDNRLLSGHPAACQVGVFYLPYFPKEYRFHFNAHNLIVIGKEGDNYLISDPIMETITSMTGYELERVRFARGPLAPRGQLYFPKEKRIVTDVQMKQAIITGIKRNVRHMLYAPGNIAGISGIRYTAKKIKKWRDTLGLQKSRSYLAQLVRMQEEIGTGGGGFRFIYAAFLQQAYAYHPVDELMDISKQFTRAGDLWRDAAIQASGIYKGRLTEQQDYNVMGDFLLDIAELEKKAFSDLSATVKKLQ
ncbi:BtrH N-terminal domain-containing protein [Agriterribacter sp.]|uniref:BtrH N-terminal domain-containing protein n=1 Tax=Agriterribacter sp. TaxID=2821509 RepID=UPI002CC8955E|nr:BtrH N-terminal domain-containing protein [Agriterribacter sp.]HTN07535.1 BtrH N-terminal domain-containing protein [Agriterribacter sp.]